MEQFVNKITTTLSSSINSSVTSLSVASASGLPSSGDFRILIDSELMLVTAISGTTLTITRGVESSTAASHSSGASVKTVLTKKALDNRFSTVNNEDTFASSSNLSITHYSNSSTNPGRVLFNKSGYLYYDNGTTWDGWALQPIYNLTSSSLSTVTGDTTGSPQYWYDATGTYLEKSNSGSDADKYYFRTMPFINPLAHDPWIAGKFELGFVPGTSITTYYSAGLVVLDSTNNNRVTFELQFNNGVYNLLSNYINSSGVVDGTYFGSDSFSYPIDNQAVKWIAIRYHANFTLKFYVSFDGNSYYQIWSVFNSTYVPTTMNHYGIFINPRVGGANPIHANIPYLFAGTENDSPFF